MSTVTPAHAAAAPQSPQSASLRKAAQGFEAIFVRQILASARQSSLGDEDLFGSQANDTFTQMRDERFADIAASTGAFGLARQLESTTGPRKHRSVALLSSGMRGLSRKRVKRDQNFKVCSTAL